ncbi:MAG: glycosyltransferase family 4 protein [Firmicutes bacterium]|nr:glycosyltransferase family 4 protein [Bacillota bacterium]
MGQNRAETSCWSQGVSNISRILQVIRPAAGGMLTHVEILMAGLRRAGYEITVACSIEETLMQRLRTIGVCRILPLDIGDGVRPWVDPLVIRRFARFLHRHPFDIVHAHGAKAGLVTRLALNYGNKLNYPVVVSYHNEILPTHRDVQQRRWRQFMERLLAKGTTHFIAVSPGIRDELLQTIGCPAEKVSFIPNGVLLDKTHEPNRMVDARANHRAQWGWAEDANIFVVGTACRLTREKGIDILLAAAARVVAVESTLRFVIMGDGPLKEELKQDAQARGLSDHVRFLGFCDTARHLFPAFDTFVLPSLTEGWPLSLMEAMVAGIPVIATRVGGIPEMVEAGRTGILVSPGEVEELTQALLAVARDRPLAKRLGSEAAEYAKKHFDAHFMVDQVERVYQRICQRTEL